MTDDEFEARVGDMLARRAPMAASPTMQARALGVVNEAIERRSLWRSWDRFAAAAVLVGVAVVVLAFALRPHGIGPTAITGAPDATPTVGIHAGDGLVGLPGAQWKAIVIIGVVVAGLTIGTMWMRRRHLSAVRIGGLIIVVGLTGLGVGRGAWREPIVSETEVRTPGLGIATTVDPDQPAGLYTPGPRARFSFGMTLRNDDFVPITILGLLKPGPDAFDAALVAMGQPGAPGPWDGSLETDPDRVRPFAPITIQPGHETFVTIVGITSDCVDGPGVPYAAAHGVDAVRLVVEVLGLERVTSIPLTPPVWLGVNDGCSETRVPYP